MVVWTQQDIQKRTEKLEKIYNDYRTKMYYWAVRIVKDPYIAEDVVHNVMLNLFREGVLSRLEKMSEDSRLAYLSTVTRNTAYNWYNREKKEKCLFELMTAERSTAMESRNDIDELIEKMCMEEVISCIRKIADTEISILTMKYVSQMTDQEIAQLLEISEAAVRKRLERAKAKLRKQFECGIHSADLSFSEKLSIEEGK